MADPITTQRASAALNDLTAALNNSTAALNDSTAARNEFTAALNETTPSSRPSYPQIPSISPSSQASYPQLPSISEDSLRASLTEQSPPGEQPPDHDALEAAIKKDQTYLYLAYGSNMASSTFRGVRGVRPLAALNVVVPSL
ncbi:MAG: hypothetical protein Q9226_009453, partial [Calogaya cf. arnoldii]